MSDNTPTNAPAPAGGSAARRKGLIAIAAVVLIAGGGYLAWQHFSTPNESTDNAYVQANVVQITPQIGGTVLSIDADDTDHVTAGETLVRLDPADAKVALQQAEAALAQTVRQVRGLYGNNSTLTAQIAARQADVARMRADVAKAQEDVDRRKPLLASGAVGKEEFEHAAAQLRSAKSAMAAAQSALDAAREQLTTSQTMTEGTDVQDHPSVAQAAAKVREAYLNVQRVELPAPVEGYVARRSVQVGQRVQAGSPLMAVVQLNDAWVDANFKEGQLRNLRIGQPAELTADVYGDKVVFHGKVVGLGAGTGSAFSLLPAQNATGNWIKVVQRVPVRIALDPEELKQHPLRVGLSMDVEVNTSDLTGPMLAGADTPSVTNGHTTSVFDTQNSEADADVQRIIAANLGKRASTENLAEANRRVSRSSRTGETAGGGRAVSASGPLASAR